MKRLFALVMAFVLVGCMPIPNIWGSSLPPRPSPTVMIFPSETPSITPTIPTAVPSQTASPTASITPTFTPAATSTPNFTPTPSKASIKRVMIISYDGMRPDAIEQAPMPNLMALMQGGAYAPLSARTIDYPATSPSHASMLSGLCMEDHGVIYNKYFMYMGYSKGVDVFDLAHEADMKTVMIVSKDKLRQLAEPETTDVFEVAYGEPAIARAVIPQIEAGFDLMFIHLAGADNRGHKYGWMSGEQFKVLRDGDEVLGQIVQALKDNGLFDTTLILVTADHGGHDKNHIGLIIEDYRIPWILYGPGVIPQQLTLSIYTMDTAATAAYALGLPLQEEWAGIPVYQAFGEEQIRTHEDNPCK
ncbi:MAG TPA: alkaline phosphatase family protein [Anaerolineales bacterium]|nr:alkaline phosphatase family protein [Anaerolineales bacterium]HNC07500.1 alkaline phosphatase family protein [Anaerolineales bacterium]